MKEKVKAIGNLAIAGLLFANAIMTAAGKSPLPIDEDSIYAVIAYIAAGADTVWVWWKNQNMTVEAQTAQKIADEMKADRLEAGGEMDPLEDDPGSKEA